MFMMRSQILKFAHLWETQKPKYLENERQFFPFVKKCINCTLRAILWQKIVFRGGGGGGNLQAIHKM